MPMKLFTMMLPPSIHAELKMIASRLRRPMAELYREALAEWLKRRKRGRRIDTPAPVAATPNSPK